MRLPRRFPLALAAGIAFISVQAVVSRSASNHVRVSPKAAEAAATQLKINRDAAAPRFNGSVNGWRIGPDDALQAEGIADRNLTVAGCQPKSAGRETETALDFTLTYMPSTVTIESSRGPTKWVCGSKGLSVAFDYDVNSASGTGSLWAERALWGRRSQAVFVASDRVVAGSINGNPAIFVHPVDDSTGLGFGEIIVIEDNSEPEFTILRVTSNDAVSFEELMRIAEGAQ